MVLSMTGSELFPINFRAFKKFELSVEDPSTVRFSESAGKTEVFIETLTLSVFSSYAKNMPDESDSGFTPNTPDPLTTS